MKDRRRFVPVPDGFVWLRCFVVIDVAWARQAIMHRMERD